MRNTYTEEYFQYLSGSSRFRSFVREKFFFAPLRRMLPGKVLDVGCGVGKFANVCSRHEYTGIDINPFCVQYLKSLGFTAEVSSSEQIPFGAEHFDSALIAHVLEHLTDPQPTLREIWRVLKPGGMLCVIVPSRTGYRSDPTHVRYYDRAGITRALADGGFQPVRSWDFPLPDAIGWRFYFNELRCLARKIDRA